MEFKLAFSINIFNFYYTCMVGHKWTGSIDELQLLVIIFLMHTMSWFPSQKQWVAFFWLSSILSSASSSMTWQAVSFVLCLAVNQAGGLETLLSGTNCILYESAALQVPELTTGQDTFTPMKMVLEVKQLLGFKLNHQTQSDRQAPD